MRIAAVAAEIVASVAIVTGLVALLEQVAPVTGLGVLYLLAVLVIAIRRGQIAAIATAVVSVTALNFFFIEPLYRLTIADSRNVVALLVFLIVALVVSRLAATARAPGRRGRAPRPPGLCARAGGDDPGAGGLRVPGGRERGDAAPADGRPPGRDRTARRPRRGSPRLPTRRRASSRCGSRPRARDGSTAGRDAGWDRASLERLAQSLARLIDLARERERLADRSAAAEAARRADATKTALLHAISHDLRSPLTAITTAASGLRAGGALGRTTTPGSWRRSRRNPHRLARMVDDLLDLSQDRGRRGQPAHRLVRPRRRWSPELPSRSSSGSAAIGSSWTLPPDLPLVRADVGAARARVLEPARERGASSPPTASRYGSAAAPAAAGSPYA